MESDLDNIIKTKEISVELPRYVISVARILEKEGFEAYLVGGSVRDLIMGKTPNDYDIATDAKPDDLLNTFPKSVATGIKFGTVLVLQKDEHGETHEVEVTTYRSESNYVDGRWPADVEFLEEINQDLGRRDFTINALALDLLSADIQKLKPEQRNTFKIIDLFDGLKDLKNKQINAVGTAQERFTEDGLRSVRACRLASQLGFEIEDSTFEAIEQTLHVTEKISKERVRDELMKMLMKSPKPSVGIEYLRKSGLLKLFIPELLEGLGVDQPKFHAHDVYRHTLKAVDVAEDSVKLAILFHDIAKPRCADGKGHFYGHDQMGADMAKEIMKRLKFSNAEIKRVQTLVKNHMFYYPFYDEGDDVPPPEKREGYWTDAAIRRFLRRVGEENIQDLFKLRVADAESNPKSSWDPREIEALEKRISEVIAEDNALHVDDLDITGHDLAELGIQKGPEMGKVLNELLEKVIEEPSLNEKEKLISIVQKDYTQ